MKDDQRRERLSEATSARSNAAVEGAAFGVTAGSMMLGAVLSDTGFANTHDQTRPQPAAAPQPSDAPERSPTDQPGQTPDAGSTSPIAEPAAVSVQDPASLSMDAPAPPVHDAQQPNGVASEPDMDPGLASAAFDGADAATPIAATLSAAGATSVGAAEAGSNPVSSLVTATMPSTVVPSTHGQSILDGLSSNLSETMDAVTSMTQELSSVLDTTLAQMNIGLDSTLQEVTGIADSVLDRVDDTLSGVLGGLPALSLLDGNRSDTSFDQQRDGPIFGASPIEGIGSASMSLLDGLSTSLLGAQRVEPADGLFGKLLGPPSDDGLGDMIGALESLAPLSLGFLGQSYMDQGDQVYDSHQSPTHAVLGLV